MHSSENYIIDNWSLDIARNEHETLFILFFPFYSNTSFQCKRAQAYGITLIIRIYTTKSPYFTLSTCHEIIDNHFFSDTHTKKRHKERSYILRLVSLSKSDFIENEQNKLRVL